MPLKFGDPSAIAAKRARRSRGPVWAEVFGRGPAGETCGTCAHLVCREYSGRYFKCALHPMTVGPGTDIRRKDPACERFDASTTGDRADL